jgi:hypothetical protein
MKQFEDLDKRLALLEQKLDLVLDNHLSHMEKDMRMIKSILGATALAVFVQFLALLSGML